jgi:hypothetical protein
MVVYDSTYAYITSCKTIKARIAALDAVIDVHFGTLLKAVTTGNINEYDLDTGQTKVKTIYRSVKDVTDALAGLEAMKNYYVNQINGRSFRLIDQSNFRNLYGRNGFRS